METAAAHTAARQEHRTTAGILSELTSNPWNGETTRKQTMVTRSEPWRPTRPISPLR